MYFDPTNWKQLTNDLRISIPFTMVILLWKKNLSRIYLEILWWIFFIIFSRTIDFNQFAYKPEDYKAMYSSDKSDRSKKTEEKKL